MQYPPNSPQSQEPYQGQPGPLGEQWHSQPVPQYSQQPPTPQQQQYGLPLQPYGPPQQYPQQQQMYQPQPVNVNIQMPQQQPPYQLQYQQPMMVNNIVQVSMNQKSHGLFVRALYFIFIGSWFGFIWLNIGFGLCALVVTLPLGLAMLNRLPKVLTLRSQGTSTNVQMTSVMTAGSVTNVVNVNVGGTKQVSFLIRALYFVFIGGWVGYIWACIGYGICLTVLGLPLGLMMLNRLPAVLTLRKN